MNVDRILTQLAEQDTAPCEAAELALWLARDEYPDLDIDAYHSELNGMAHEARSYLRGTLEARVTGLCRYLFHEMGFRGNVQNYYDPRNSYMNQVLDRRTGIPITMTVLAMTVGQRAGLRVVGIGLPGHFIAKAIDQDQELLFDPFHGGRQLTATDCTNLVLQATGAHFEPTPETLLPVSLRQLMIRMLTNLKTIYWKQSDHARAVRVLERLRQLQPLDVLLCRDLGISLVHSGQPGRAIDHLSTYLASAPLNDEVTLIRKLRDQALGELGQWN